MTMGRHIKGVLIAAGIMVLLPGCQKTQTAPQEERSVLLSQDTDRGEDSEKQSDTGRADTEQTDTESKAKEQEGITVLSFSDMYAAASSSRGLQFSDAFAAMDGQTVQIAGYMAPPLKPVFSFFVLSKQPMSICPFCSTDADWPADIVAVYVEEGARSVANDTLLTITGTLELGSYTDEETGFVSQARIYADRIENNR